MVSIIATPIKRFDVSFGVEWVASFSFALTVSNSEDASKIPVAMLAWGKERKNRDGVVRLNIIITYKLSKRMAHINGKTGLKQGNTHCFAINLINLY